MRSDQRPTGGCGSAGSVAVARWLATGRRFRRSTSEAGGSSRSVSAWPTLTGATDVRRQRREGAGAGRGVDRRGAGQRATIWRWSCRRGSVVGSSSTAACSTGRLGNAGHIGHVVVEPDGRPCVCGGRGCLEAEASGTAIAAVTGRPTGGRRRPDGGRTDGHAGRPGGRVGGDAARPRSGGRRAGRSRSGSAAVLRGGPARARGTGRRCRSRPATRLLPAGLGAEGPLVGAGAVRSAGAAIDGGWDGGG